MNVIRWSMKDTTGCVRKRKDCRYHKLPEVLLDFEKDAVEVLRKTDADHVLYAIKIYDASDKLKAVQFFMNPMSDEDFYKMAGKGRGTLVYALHNRKRKAATE